MIKNLQRKFVATMMGVLIIVFAIVIIALNYFMRSSSAKQTDALLEMLANSDGIIFEPQQGKHYPQQKLFEPQNAYQNQAPNHDKLMRASRFFYAKVDHYGNIYDVHHEMMLDFTHETVISYVNSALERSKNKGSIENYQYLIAEKDYGQIIIFAERSIEIKLLSELIYYSMILAAISFVLFFISSIFLSKWAVKPVKTAFDKQRRFISDASHELKTPLTIISANADVLENEIGKNQRISSIRTQSIGMNDLIHDMLSLARADESENQVKNMSQFDLSQTVLNTVLEFESFAFEEGKTLEYDVQENVTFFGNATQIRQLISILVDNAIKYSNPSGKIEVKLKKQSKKTLLSVYNTGTGIEESEKEKIFERFYRSDDSRSRETGGYGLGLAIAKNNVDLHKGKIVVSGLSGKWICITVQFNNQASKP